MVKPRFLNYCLELTLNTIVLRSMLYIGSTDTTWMLRKMELIAVRYNMKNLGKNRTKIRETQQRDTCFGRIGFHQDDVVRYDGNLNVGRMYSDHNRQPEAKLWIQFEPCMLHKYLLQLCFSDLLKCDPCFELNFSHHIILFSQFDVSLQNYFESTENVTLNRDLKY